MAYRKRFGYRGSRGRGRGRYSFSRRGRAGRRRGSARGRLRIGYRM